MKRRAFVAGMAAVMATPLVSEPQQARVPRIGYLTASLVTPFHSGFKDGLRQAGYVEGQSILVEYRVYEGLPDRAAVQAAELARSNVDVIVAVGPAAGKAVRDATHSIPAVFALVADPIGDGLVVSMAKPGRNMTGVAFTPTPAVTAKVVELLREALPRMSRIALLWNPSSVGNERYYEHAREASRTLNLSIESLPARNLQEIESALSVLGNRVDALVIVAEALLTIHRARIIESASRQRIPTASYLPEFADSGSLLAYGPSPTDLLRRAAEFVVKILRGAKPADIPVEQPTNFSLVVNLRIARTLGISIPPALLARADRTIE